MTMTNVKSAKPGSAAVPSCMAWDTLAWPMTWDMSAWPGAAMALALGPGTLDSKVQAGKRRWRSDSWEKEPYADGRMIVGIVKEEGGTGTGGETGCWKQDG